MFENWSIPSSLFHFCIHLPTDMEWSRCGLTLEFVIAHSNPRDLYERYDFIAQVRISQNLSLNFVFHVTRPASKLHVFVVCTELSSFSSKSCVSITPHISETVTWELSALSYSCKRFVDLSREAIGSPQSECEFHDACSVNNFKWCDVCLLHHTIEEPSHFLTQLPSPDKWHECPVFKVFKLPNAQSKLGQFSKYPAFLLH